MFWGVLRRDAEIGDLSMFGGLLGKFIFGGMDFFRDFF